MKPVIHNKDAIPEDYKEVVDESILEINFEPDVVQRQGFYCIEKNQTIFVSAHTSSGKTLIAEFAIKKALKSGRKIIYTSPIKALSNQKYSDFKKKFQDVGIITGDVQLNTDASCLIMTTEILRNYLYRNSDIIGKIDYVIFDEIHYINERSRGVVWEEAIILLPSRINFVMLSATISNSHDFAMWISKMKEKRVHLISTSKRVVPLEYKIIRNNCLYNREGHLVEEIKYKDVRTYEAAHLKKAPKKETEKNVFRQNDLHRVNVYCIGKYLKENDLTPAIFFCFSKKMCHVHAKTLKTLNFLKKSESQQVEEMIFDAMHKSTADFNLPQVEAAIGHLKCGAALMML